MKVTEEPAATETVVVEAPLLPPTLQRRSVDARSVTGELLLVFLRMFWYWAPLTPFAVRYWKMSSKTNQLYPLTQAALTYSDRGLPRRAPHREW